MSDLLLAVLLATTSAKGSNLVCQWPPHPSSSPRLRRAPPKDSFSPSQLDNPWKASHPFHENPPARNEPLEDDYFWQYTPSYSKRDRSTSAPRRSSSSGRSTPTRAESTDYSANGTDATKPPDSKDYGRIFGYSSEFLAGLLCPIRSICHQKFELLVDELGFIGHPVCADEDGVWRVRADSKLKLGPRGRDNLTRLTIRTLAPQSSSGAPGNDAETEGDDHHGWLQTFHVVFVIDLPDTSSAASGNVSKFLDAIYKDLAFTVTAILYREQILYNYVEMECDKLIALRDDCLSQGLPFSEFTKLTLEQSSIAAAMKTIFEAVKSSSIAYITLHDLPVELQLPPYLDNLLNSELEFEEALQANEVQDENGGNWGEDLQIGWRLPSLTPWKGLLLLDDDPQWNPTRNLERASLGAGDKDTAEGLLKFLELASVTLSLRDMATLLDWDLDEQIFPVVRWLVKHRRAKVVDVVHPGLRTVYTIPNHFDRPLAELTKAFHQAFVVVHPHIPSLPVILSTISASSSTTESTFFTALVKDKTALPLWNQILIWLLKHDLLVTLHLRIRLVATVELKERVANKKPLFVNRGRRKTIEASPNPEDIHWISMSPRTAHNFSRRLSSKDSGKSQLSELDMGSSNESDAFVDDDEDEDEESSGVDYNDVDYSTPTIITEPGKADRIQRRWLAAMSQDKDPWIVRRFQQIYQYFDGRKTDSEILYRADITRKELREVLHDYQEYILSFLHPS